MEPERGKLRLVQWANGRGPQVHDAWDPTVDLDRLFALLKTKKLVAHNTNFEEAWLREYGVEAHLDDTMVMSRVLYGGPPPSRASGTTSRRSRSGSWA